MGLGSFPRSAKIPCEVLHWPCLRVSSSCVRKRLYRAIRACPGRFCALPAACPACAKSQGGVWLLAYRGVVILPTPTQKTAWGMIVLIIPCPMCQRRPYWPSDSLFAGLTCVSHASQKKSPHGPLWVTHGLLAVPGKGSGKGSLQLVESCPGIF